jgi:hypothetical protein
MTRCRVTEEQKIQALRMYSRLSNVLLVSVISGVILHFVTVIPAVAIPTKPIATVASSIFGVVSTFVSGAIYK